MRGKAKTSIKLTVLLKEEHRWSEFHN